MESPATNETSRLLPHHDGEEPPNQRSDASDKNVHTTAVAVLPIGLLSALAMAATAATTVYAYAYLTCKDATHCRDTERNRYAGSVAIAITIANVCALLAIGTMARVSERSHKTGLAIWIICRSMSVAVLAFGVYVRSISVAVCGQIFEGLASDNILHLNLNAIYVQVPEQKAVSRLIGSSLALYMIGISMGPSFASLLGDFRASFALAAALFVATLLYLLICIPSTSTQSRQTTAQVESQDSNEVALQRQVWKLLGTPFAPLSLFLAKPLTVIPAMALFLYNLVQSYSFYAIMVHASLEFGFSSRQNGFLISIAHATASIYLLSALYVAPFLLRRIRNSAKNQSAEQKSHQGRSDVAFAVGAMLTQALALSFLGFADEPWQLYAIVVLCAFGLSTPSFVKSSFVSHFDKSKGPQAVAALAIMETLGALLAPSMLGGLQVVSPGKGVFLFASGCVGVAALIFGTGSIALEIQKQRRPANNHVN